MKSWGLCEGEPGEYDEERGEGRSSTHVERGRRLDCETRKEEEDEGDGGGAE